MIAGRLRWREPGKKPGMGPKLILASFVFEHGTLFFTEASSKKRASLQLVRGEATRCARSIPAASSRSTRRSSSFATRSRARTTRSSARSPIRICSAASATPTRTRSCTRARLSPLKLTRSLTDDEFARLLRRDARDAARVWIDRLRAQTGGGFPEKVTAFRDEMAVHGRFKQPCPVCGAPVQRIVYADERDATTARAARPAAACSPTASLSRLLKDDWPRRSTI